MELTDIQWELFDFVKQQHVDQRRKYTGEPYFIHLLRVAEIISEFPIVDQEVEIGLCHDLFERTKCTRRDLSSILSDLGYGLVPRNRILQGVQDLTNFYTDLAYSGCTRSERKLMEGKRLCAMESFSQSVKYAELIDNIPSLVIHDPELAWIYVKETNGYLWQLNAGNSVLYRKCYRVLDLAVKELLINKRNI